MSVNSGPEAWLLHDGRAGHWRQVSALAHFLPVECSVHRVQLKPPWGWLAPYRFPGGRLAHADLLPASAGPPQAIISCGRRSALAARWLNLHFNGRPKTVQILDCGLSPGHFTWVIAPRHDRLQGDNVVTTIGSLNPVDESWLSTAVDGRQFPSLIGGRPDLLLLGGASRHFDFSRAWVKSILSRLRLQGAGETLIIAESPRTPAWVEEEINKVAGPFPVVMVPWLKESPERSAEGYRAALARARRIFVTADSVNLVSEACASGKPVHLLGAGRVKGKLARFSRCLIREKYVFDGLPEAPADESMPQTRCLRETQAVAEGLIESGLLG